MSRIWIISIIFILLALATSSQCNISSDIYNSVKSSVVVVLANNSQDVILSQGTGFFIDNMGDIITNLHVINGSSKVNVITADGHKYPVENVLAKDISSDLVCLSVNIPSQLVHPIKLNTTPPEVGDGAYVVSYTEGPGGYNQEFIPVSVSSIQMLIEYGEVVQIYPQMYPGQSGSPLLNSKCEAIGIITFGYLNGKMLKDFAVSCKQVSKLIQEFSPARGATPITKWNLTLADRLYATAVDLFRKGEYNQSINYSIKAIELNPQSTTAWEYKAMALGRLGRYDEALQASEKAIELDPNNALAWENKAFALERLYSLQPAQVR
jgi:hypothetical protein